MSRVLLTELARILLTLAMVALVVSLLLGYGSWRLLRRVTIGAPAPLQQAAFGLVTACTVFVQALGKESK